MVPADDEEIEVMARVIREYLSTHPDAADTVDGIMTWWLARDYYLRYRTLVEQALDTLVKRGVLYKKNPHEGEAVFSLIR